MTLKTMETACRAPDSSNSQRSTQCLCSGVLEEEWQLLGTRDTRRRNVRGDTQKRTCEEVSKKAGLEKKEEECGIGYCWGHD